MELIDIIIIALLVLGAIRGLQRGMAAAAAAVAGALLGLVACRLWGDASYAFLTAHTDVETFPGAPYTGTVLAYILIFVPVFIGSLIVGHLAKDLLSALHLGAVDRLGGTVLGMAKYMLVLSLVLNLIYIIAPESSIFESSTLLGGEVMRIVMRFAPWLWGLDLSPVIVTAE